MTSTHYTRRRSATAAIVVVLAVVFAPALSPAALAYDAKAGGPDASARLILPDWDALDGGIDPFDRKEPQHAGGSSNNWGGNESMLVGIALIACGFTPAAGLCAIYGFGWLIAETMHCHEYQYLHDGHYHTHVDCHFNG